MSLIIPWYTKDTRFEPGTVADVGDLRVRIRKTERKSGNQWRIYTEWRTHEKDGVKEELKREICVAAYSGKLSLEEIQQKATEYVKNFVFGILLEMEA